MEYHRKQLAKGGQKRREKDTLRFTGFWQRTSNFYQGMAN